MSHYEQDAEKMAIVMEIAVFLGVRVRDGVDTFGRPYLEIDPAGLQRMHSLALGGGHHEVAEDIRQMLVRGERVDPE